MDSMFHKHTIWVSNVFNNRHNSFAVPLPMCSDLYPNNGNYSIVQASLIRNPIRLSYTYCRIYRGS